MDWPVIYIHKHKDEELMAISFDEWYHDVDARHAIGPINDNEHYVIDSSSDVYRLKKGMDDKVVPPIEFGEKIDSQEILTLVRERASKWDEISSVEISKIIDGLIEY